MSNLVEYAKSELEKAFPGEDDEMQKMAIANVIELIETFSSQGHSGFSAHYVLNLFTRLVNWNPISYLTGEEDEWGEPYGEDETQQNKRCGKVFRRHHDNSTAVNIEGVVFEQPNGIAYTNKNSEVPIEFPYWVPDKPEVVKTEE